MVYWQDDQDQPGQGNKTLRSGGMPALCGDGCIHIHPDAVVDGNHYPVLSAGDLGLDHGILYHLDCFYVYKSSDIRR